MASADHALRLRPEGLEIFHEVLEIVSRP